MKFKDLRQNLDEAQLANIAQMRKLAKGGALDGKNQSAQTAALAQAMTKLQQAGGNISKLSAQHRQLVMGYTGKIAKAVTSTPSAMSAALRSLKNEELTLEAANIPHDPPLVMVLKRKGIRIFPDGKKVALYTNDQLGLTFTVPYVGGSHIEPTVSTGIGEDVEDYGEEMLNENIKRLRFASSKKGTPVSIGFKTHDENMKVDPITAKAITQLHSQLSPENKIELVRKISKSPEDFKHVASFAHKNLTYKNEKSKNK